MWINKEFCFNIAWFFGDPHFTTLDGGTYTFNGHGEYILMQLESMDFTIQCRTSRAERTNGTMSEATIFSAFVVKANNTWLQIELNDDKNGVEVYAGNAKDDYAEYTLDYYRLGDSFSVSDISGLDLHREGNTTVSIFTDSGLSFITVVSV